MAKKQLHPRPPLCPNLLLVESDVEKQIIPHLMENNGVLWSNKPEDSPVWIEPQEGYSNILKPKVISTELQNSGLRSLGIVIDADQDPQARWKELRDACLPSIPDIPDTLSETGLIHTVADGIRFGVWMMPDNQSRGMLETFLVFLIPDKKEELWIYAQEVVSEAKNRGANFIDNHQDKANIYTWLAWQKPPGQKFRDAITEKILEPSHPRSQNFVTWFKSLYGL